MESVSSFNAITYKTHDGETITATKKDGMVTLVGNKNGTRQMPLEDFKKELVATAHDLERSPKTDTVSFSANSDTKEEPKIVKPGAGAVIGGVVAGTTVQGLTGIPQNIVAPKIMNKMESICSSISAEECAQVDKAAAQLLKDSGLEAKGVNIIKATAENTEEVSKIMSKEIDSGILKHLPEELKDFLGKFYCNQTKTGKNAFYAPASKMVVIPEEKLRLSVFHEAGHGMNANLSTIGKILQKSRSMTLLAIPIAMIAMFKTQKAPGEEPKNKVDKATTFIKNNAGKLTFATFLPVLLEEGLATIKGNSYAKKFLSPEVAKKVAKTNAFGFSSYLMAATLSGFGIYIGTKVKDAIAHRKMVNTEK